MAQAVLNLSTGRQSITLTARGDVRAHPRPGDGVGVVDRARPGRHRQPDHTRPRRSPGPVALPGLDWPVTQGMGVYYRSGAGGDGPHPYMDWEDGQTTTVIVGAGVGGVGDDTARAGSPTEGAISARWNDAVGLIAIADNQTADHRCWRRRSGTGNGVEPGHSSGGDPAGPSLPDHVTVTLRACRT